jgi:spore coat polysaccharide biosynthesis protein SpsF (cytidylyltransferase family)
MALSEFEIKRTESLVEKFIEKRRPSPEIRDQLDLGFRIKGQSVEIFEIRPVWNNPKKKIEESVAKATFVKTNKSWKIYWKRADLKWHRYDPDPEVDYIEDFLKIVGEDEFCCFWG